MFGFLLGWVVGPFVILECVQTKLVHYFLPAIPACALLAAWLVDALTEDGVNLRRWPLGRLGIAVYAGTALTIVVTLAACAIVLPSDLRPPLLVLAAILCAGSLYGLRRLQTGATAMAVKSLSATWAVVMSMMCGWLLPAAEPYRTPRVVGERLAALAKQRNVAPVLHSFQEPSVVYAVGHPVPMIRTWETLRAQVAQHGAVVTALLPIELDEFRKRTYLELELLDQMQGFNLNKGLTETLQFLVVRERPSARLARLQETVIK
jgi:4-amino-4-deoxy-L-arabinose transferase-like glycosyltransferase